MSAPRRFTDLASTVDYLIQTLGKDLKVGAPLGLGKPNDLLNELYARARKDPTLTVALFTALSLDPPSGAPGLGGRFLGPFRRRQWGDDYPRLQYVADANKGTLPPNFSLHEFYVQAGAALKSVPRQRAYQSLNYTHVPRALLREGLQGVVQLVSPDPKGSGQFSLSCNPDVTLELVELSRQAGHPLLTVGVVHPELPFLTGEAQVPADYFDVLVEPPTAQPLFALPRGYVDNADHGIGFHASQWVVDNGTLQIGIGSLSDALVASLLCRHQRPELYGRLVGLCSGGNGNAETTPFKEGLYGLSEMVMDGFLHLRKAGILKRTVKDPLSGVPTYLHGAFFLGSRSLYDWLRTLEGDDFSGLRMGRVTWVNDLYDPRAEELRAQRRNARFFNTCMQVTLLGGAASETLEDGRVVSGVGGQYNFVAMSHELEDARSILMLRSTRDSAGERSSNVVWGHGHLTIPRHLRDVVVTEYGSADVRGKSDEQTIQALLNIADSAFQEGLREQAVRAGKLDPNYRIPDWARNNTPESLDTFLAQGRREGLFGPFPLGSDFTPVEERLVAALEWLKPRAAGGRKLRLLLGALGASGRARDIEALERMGLAGALGWKDRLARRVLSVALQETSL